MDEGQFLKELVDLRQGRAMTRGDVKRYVGPALRTLSRVTEEDGDSETFRKVRDALEGLIASLPTDLREAAKVALGLLAGFDQPTYTLRIHAAQSLFRREEKAIRRRIDESFAGLARLATEEASRATRVLPAAHTNWPWHTESLTLTLSLESVVPEAFEIRTIVAAVDELSEVELALSVPSGNSTPPDAKEKEMSVDVFQGGTLVKRAMQSNDRLGLILRLPQPLAIGQRHTFMLRYQAKLQFPHYACTPRYPCESLDITVRFGEFSPSLVIRLDEVFQDDARDTSPNGTTVSVDAAGEAHATFQNLRPGFAYGLRWL